MKSLIKPSLLLALGSFFLFENVLSSQNDVFREFEAAMFSLQWMLFICLTVCCGTCIYLTFTLKDLLLVSVLVFAVAMYLASDGLMKTVKDALTLLAGVTLGKSASVLLRRDKEEASPSLTIQDLELRNFLVGLILLLAFSSWWHLNMSTDLYHGPRWKGLWNSPNIYGMLMSAGGVIVTGLLAGERSRLDWRSMFSASNTVNTKRQASSAARGAALPIFLFIASGIMGVGLLFSYSRGAWVGTTVGLLYLAKAYGKFKWRFMLLGVFIVAAGTWFFWSSTSDTAPWYMKRLDLARPSAQHRVVAWRGAVQLVWDHPLGVGWNKAVDVYAKNYSPPEGGAAAIMTNDYLMLAAQLGFAGLLFFISYVALCLRSPKLKSGHILNIGRWPLDSTRVACRAGALTLAVEFWFDGGLFTLATASVFWVLLELGAERTQLAPGSVESQPDI